MAEMLLINPRKRRAGIKRRKTAQRSTVSAKRVTRRRRSASGYAANPISQVRRRVRNRIAKAHHKIRRRRRNPIGGVNMQGIVPMIKRAAIGGAGAVAMDALMTQVNKFMPASLQGGHVGLAVQAVLSVALGKGLSRATKGVSETMAVGALTVQAADLVRSLTSGMTGMSGMGYAVPAAVARGTARVSPIVRMAGVGAYTRSGTGSPLLNAYTRSGTGSPLLNGVGNARQREMQRR
jgi:hypothetical protein